MGLWHVLSSMHAPRLQQNARVQHGDTVQQQGAGMCCSRNMMVALPNQPIVRAAGHMLLPSTTRWLRQTRIARTSQANCLGLPSPGQHALAVPHIGRVHVRRGQHVHNQRGTAGRQQALRKRWQQQGML